MSTSTAAPTKKAHPARQRALEAYLTKIRGWCTAPASEEELQRQARVRIGQRAVVVEPWERAQIRRHFGSAERGGEAPEYTELIAQGTALLVKITLDVESIKHGDELASAKLYALQAELMLDTALGMALLKEAQRWIDDAVQSGQVETAKNLSGFKHKLKRAVSEAKQCIADSEYSRAEALSGSLSDLEDDDTSTAVEDPWPTAPGSSSPTGPALAPDGSAELVEQIQQIAPQRRRKRSRPRSDAGPSAASKRPSSVADSTRILAIGLALSAASWFALVAAPRWVHDAPAVLGMRDMRDADLLTRVEARPPSLFVTIGQEGWSGLDPAGRDRLLDDLANEAATAGYTGLHLRSATGRPLARWLRDTGGAMIVHGEEPSEPDPLPTESGLPHGSAGE